MRLFPPRAEFARTLLLIVVAIVSGALSGAIAGWTVESWQLQEGGYRFGGTDTSPNAQTSSTEPGVTVIPVDRTPQASLVPTPFEGRRASSVAGVYVARTRTASELLTDEELVTQAVAVTSDGWFVVPTASLEGVRIADVLVWHEGLTSSVTQAVEDTFGGVIFLKTTLTGTSAPAFARGTDVTAGLAAWLERRANQFEPVGIAALGAPAQALVGLSSETVQRRGVLVGPFTAEGDQGAPVWSANGALVGTVVSHAGAPLQYLPSSGWADSLSSLLATGEIHHASLGVRTVDLAWARVVRTGEDALPVRGALLVAGAAGATREPAIVPRSPAAQGALQAGDVIERVDRDILDGSADLAEVLAGYRPGSRVTLTVRRGIQTIEVPVTLGTVVTSEER